jgi:thioredoxin 1
MKSSQHIPSVICLCLAATFAQGGQTFAPLDQWKTAVLSGDKAALAPLYSTDPPAAAQVGKTKVANLDEELRFWAGLKSSAITKFNPKLLDISNNQGKTRLLLRIEAVQENSPVVASMAQVWEQQADGWRIVATGRSEFSPAAGRRLPQPAIPNTSLYPDPGEAQAELKTASATAARDNKRVLVVFGANWCYDCHVLDVTFHSKEFAALVNANYVVVHINTGEEGKDNHDLAARLGVVLDHGIPSLAVLNADGSVVVAQRGGEFESTVKIGPEDVRAFLEKWKPAPR